MITGKNINTYQLFVVRQGLKALLKGFKINTAYTSTRCRDFVTTLTGKQYKAGRNGLLNATMDLEAIIKAVQS